MANAKDLIFSKDASYLISQGISVKVWNVSNKTLVNQIKTGNNNVTACLGITADKNYLIIMDEKQSRIFLWKITEGKEVFSEPLSNTTIAYTQLSEDGTTLLVTSPNNISKLFNMALQTG